MPHRLMNDRTRRAVAFDVEIAATRSDRRRGLLGRESLGASEGLLLSPCIAVHTAFMRFSIDLVFIDTAGRLHTKVNLMEELRKIKRVIQKHDPAAPHEVLLVLDASTGQNGMQQAKQFGASVGVTGLILTKLDGTAKGGIVLAISRELNIPVKFIGVGERIEDLQPFDRAAFVEALFAP